MKKIHVFKKLKHKEALLDLNKSIEINPSYSIAYDTRQQIKFALNDFKGCIADCNSAISLDSEISNSYFYKGRALYKLGNKSQACTEWTKAGELGNIEALQFSSKYCNSLVKKDKIVEKNSRPNSVTNTSITNSVAPTSMTNSIKVFDNAPLYDKPDKNSKVIGYLNSDDFVLLIREQNENYSFVESNGLKGYLWFRWIKW